MKYTDEDLETLDLDWFAKDKLGNIGHFTTNGKGFVPKSVMSSVENNNELVDFIYSLPIVTEAVVIEESLPSFIDEKARGYYVQAFEEIASRGIFSYDASKVEGSSGDVYVLVAKPNIKINITTLPFRIVSILLRTELTSTAFGALSNKVNKSDIHPS